ncbi:MAG: GNAT family N-acetyltransferase [Candidatus Glassbacteria bacterium]
MARKVKLKDGTEVTIRPMRQDDLDRSVAFFQELPPEDRTYLRVDVTKRDVVKERIRAIETGKVKRLVAIAQDRIVADGALELAGHGWKEHVGELRLIVARQYQRKGLGLIMARELYKLAARQKVEEIVVKMMRPQHAAHSIFQRLGFQQEVLLPEYVKDLNGEKQDLIVMRCNLEVLWKTLEHYMADSDWQRTR